MLKDSQYKTTNGDQTDGNAVNQTDPFPEQQDGQQDSEHYTQLIDRGYLRYPAHFQSHEIK